jgi:hypothetical protein
MTATAPRRPPPRSSSEPSPQDTRYVQVLEHYRTSAGISMDELARSAGISRPRLTDMAAGRIPIQGDECLRLQRVLGAGGDLRSGSPGPVVSGSAVEPAWRRWQLGMRVDPPSDTSPHPGGGGGDRDDQPEVPWSGRTTWGAIAGADRCGWCRRVHPGRLCP